MNFKKLDTGYYEVTDAGKKLGELVKERRKGSGRASRGYVGYVPAYTVWVWWPEDDDKDGATFDVNTLTEAKARLADFLGNK